MTSARAQSATSSTPARMQDGQVQGGRDTPPAHPFDTALDAELSTADSALRTLFPLPPPKAPRTRKGLRSGGLTAMVAGIAAGLLYWADPAWRTEHHATGAGERRDVALADGSTLSLDAATALDMVWRLRSRRVALVQGQARFAVVPSSWRPFQVAAASARIRVVGTVFDVRRQGDRVQVTVLQGRVEVRNQGDASGPLALLPGQRLRMEEGRPTAVPQSVDLAQAGAWRQGRLVFDRTPLREALADVQRHRSAPIRLHDDGRLGRHAISGVFEAERTDQMLDLLPRIVPAQVQRRADGSVDIAPAAR